MDDQYGVVHHRADEDHKAEHGQHVERLRCDQDIRQPQPNEPADGRQRDCEHNNEWIEKIFKQGRHQQVCDDHSQQEIPLERPPGFHQLVCFAAQGDLYILQQSVLGHRVNGLLDRFNGSLQGHGIRRGDFQPDIAFLLQAVDLGHPLRVLDMSHVADPDKLAVAVNDRAVQDVLGALEIRILAADHEVYLVNPLWPIFVDFPAIHEHIHVNAEIRLGQSTGGQLGPIRNDIALGVCNLQGGNWPDLALGNSLANGPEEHAGGSYHFSEFLRGNVYVYRPTPSQLGLEDTGLEAHAEHVGQGMDDPGH